MKRWCLVGTRTSILAGALACTGNEPSKSLASATDSLIGTWRVVSHRSSAGSTKSTTLPFGEHPRGYLVYDASGHVFLQVQRAGAADSL